MSTLVESLCMQKKHGILRAPTRPTGIGQAQSKAATNPTLAIGLQNNTKSANVWAYITGLDLNRNNAVFVLRNDGVTAYYPESPSRTLAPLAQDCHIKLGGPGTTRTVTIPQLVGGRIWFCVDGQLTFYVNPGPALVEPSVMNPTDPNYHLQWSFAEFTYNKIQLFANITYVDFVGVPVSLALTSNNPAVPPQHVPGMDPSGLDAVCAQLLAQHGVDGADWDKLIIKTASGLANLRALSPNAGIKLFAPSGVNLFSSYYDSYVSAVWRRYALEPLTLNTQAAWGILRGTVVRDDVNGNNSLGRLTFPGVGAFPPPSTADIFSCDSGAFGHYATNTEVMGNITARLAAAFNRSTLLSNPNQPDGEVISRYYRDHPITNHYSRIVHGVNRDGKGYAFPYDDVAPRDEDNVAGVVAGDDPAVFIVAIGGEAVIPLAGGAGRGVWWRLRRLLWGDDLDPDTDSLGSLNHTGNQERGTDSGTGLVVPRLTRLPESLVPPTTEQAAWRRVEDRAERDADREAETEAEVGDQIKGEGETSAAEVAGQTGGRLRLRAAARAGLVWRLLWLVTLAAGLVGVLYRRAVVAALLMVVSAAGLLFWG